MGNLEPSMRLKSSDGPISIHNVNDVLNSPKRINTLHNSNITSNLTTNSLLTYQNSNRNEETTTELTNITKGFDDLNNVQNEALRVQWSKSARDKQRELSNNVNNQQRNQYANINNTLAASLRNTNLARRDKTTSVYSESSPDDSFFDYEEANHSASSADTSPQDEERDFDLSDSESFSEEGNLNRRKHSKTVIQRRGIVNPNYPGFQHFANALDFTIKVSSDTDLTDDDYECELVGSENRSQFIEKNDDINNLNNNNIEETEDFQIDKIDSVNRLDSVENIQKVFYDKPVLNLDCENLNQIFSDLESSSNNSTQASDEDTAEKLPFQKIEVELNIKAEEVTYKCAAFNEVQTKKTPELEKPLTDSANQEIDLTSGDIVGDFGREVEDEFGRIASENTSFFTNPELEDIQFDFKINFEPSWERAVVQEIEEAIGKLTELLDFEPTANTYQYEPNTEEPFAKYQPSHTDESQIINENELKEALISEDLEGSADEQPGEFLDFEPKPQEYKLEEIIEETLNRLSDCKENNPPIVLEDSRVIQIDMAVIQDNKMLENIQDVTEVKPKTMSTIGLGENKGKIRDHEKMEVESEINELKRDSNRQLEEIEFQIKKMKSDTTLSPKSEEEMEKFCKEDKTKEFKEKEEDTVVKRRERSDVVRRRKDYNQQFGSLIQFPRKEGAGKHAANRRSVPAAKEKKKYHSDNLGSFDVYNIETAMPKIDLEAIELHLRAAREEERRVSRSIIALCGHLGSL